MHKMLIRSAKSILSSLHLQIEQVFKKNSLWIFNFHQVSAVFDPSTQIPGTWTCLSVFEDSMKYIKQEFTLLPLKDALDRSESGQLTGRNAAITFDDGDVSLQTVLPILTVLGIPATFFINSAYLENQTADFVRILNLFQNENDSGAADDAIRSIELKAFRNTDDPDYYTEKTNLLSELYLQYPQKKRFYIDNDFLANLDGEQFHIGLHGHEHHRHALKSEEWQKENIERNIRYLSDFRSYEPIFAVPFGRRHDWNRDTLKICLEKQLSFLLHEGGINYGSNLLIQRIPSDNGRISSLIRKQSII